MKELTYINSLNKILLEKKKRLKSTLIHKLAFNPKGFLNMNTSYSFSNYNLPL